MDEKHFNYYSIYFIRYDHRNVIRKLSLYYHELVEKTEEHNGENI